MKALQDLEIFVRTADTASLSATARGLGITPAAASASLWIGAVTRARMTSAARNIAR